MKKLFENITGNGRQIFEMLFIAGVSIMPFLIDLQKILQDYQFEYTLSPDIFLWHLAIVRGNLVAAVIFAVTSVIAIRKINKDFLMNRKFVYHDYCYAWYWLCAKVLGIKKCNLVLVPIYMQFKLVIKATFEEYPLCESDYPPVENEGKCQVIITNTENDDSEINVIIEDTYPIAEQQIPESKRKLKTIRISRNDGADNGRHFSQNLVNAVINSVRGVEQGVAVNVFATTNPLNTRHIASGAFGLGNRGNVSHLYVFQQMADGIRSFDSKEHRIY